MVSRLVFEFAFKIQKCLNYFWEVIDYDLLPNYEWRRGQYEPF